MIKHIFTAMALTVLPAIAQEAPAITNETQPAQTANRPPRIDEETMGMLLVARELVMEKYDQDKNGRLSPEERELIKKDTQDFRDNYIKKYDTDGDGTISPDEFKAIQEAWSKDNPELQEKISVLFQNIVAASQNNNRAEGRRNRSERSENADRQERANRGERPNAERRAPGPRGDGENRPRWGRNVMMNLQARDIKDPVLAAHVIAVLEKYDADKDGILSSEEYKAFMKDAKSAHEKRQMEMEKRRKEMLEKYDKDGDGKLSREEMRAMREDRNSNN